VYLENVLSQLKLIYVEYQKHQDAKPIEEPAADSKDETKEKSEK
jgi:hypothetical protein